MDDVLRIVRHDDVEMHPVLLLHEQHALVNPVEIVGFRGGAVVRAHRQVEVFHVLLGLADGRDRRRVVGIGADEEIVVAVTVGRNIVLHHFLDDAVLFP
jgi:hypothetical protein